VRFLASDEDNERVMIVAKTLYDTIQSVVNADSNWQQRVIQLQVTPAPLAKIKGKYRWQVYLKWWSGDDWHALDRLYDAFASVHVPSGMTMHMEEDGDFQ